MLKINEHVHLLSYFVDTWIPGNGASGGPYKVEIENFLGAFVKLNDWAFKTRRQEEHFLKVQGEFVGEKGN